MRRLSVRADAGMGEAIAGARRPITPVRAQTTVLKRILKAK